MRRCVSSAALCSAAFIRDYPDAARAGEAAALLGWLLIDAGDLDEAHRQFRSAAADAVPAVRRSARRGLDAIDELRD